MTNLHAETMSIRCDITNHFTLLNVANLVSRIDAESIDTIIYITSSCKCWGSGITISSNQNGIDMKLDHTNGKKLLDRVLHPFARGIWGTGR